MVEKQTSFNYLDKVQTLFNEKNHKKPLAPTSSHCDPSCRPLSPPCAMNPRHQSKGGKLPNLGFHRENHHLIVVTNGE